VHHWRYQDVAVVIEADESPIEEVIGVWSEQQAVFAVQPLLVARIAPRLAVARA